MLIELLLVPSIVVQESAIEALIALLSRNIAVGDENREHCIIGPIFQHLGIRVIEGLWAKLHGYNTPLAIDLQEKTKLDDDNYRVAKRLANVFIY